MLVYIFQISCPLTRKNQLREQCAKWGKVMKQYFLVVPLTSSRYKSAKKGRGARKHDCWSRIKKDCGITFVNCGDEETALMRNFRTLKMIRI